MPTEIIVSGWLIRQCQTSVNGMVYSSSMANKYCGVIEKPWDTGIYQWRVLLVIVHEQLMHVR